MYFLQQNSQIDKLDVAWNAHNLSLTFIQFWRSDGG